MAYPNPIVNAILTGARRRGLDPQAVLAVASVEGLGGGIGDQGTSFGPFQLHAGGALPRGLRNPQQWAISPAGIDYALNQIARVASGRRGRAAVESIVRGFERPADPGGEILKALSKYGKVGGGSVSAPPVVGGAPNRRALALALISQGNQMFGLAPLPAGLGAQSIPRASAPQQVSGKPPRRSGKTLRWLEHFVSPFGLSITSTTHGKHVKGSYHYKGRAVDVAGSPARMRALAEAALQHPEQFSEMFYDPLGVYVKNGRVVKGSIGGHSDHVHLAR